MNDTYIFMFGAMLLVIVVLAIKLFYRPAKPVEASAASGPTTTYRVIANPGRVLIDHMDELGKDRAGSIIEDKLGAHRALQFTGMIRDAFGDPVPPPPPSPKP